MSFYKNLVSLLLPCIVCVVQAQNTKSDSLRRLLQLNKAEDTMRVNVLNELGKANFRISVDTVRLLGNQALMIAKKLDFKKGIAKAENNIGVSYYFESEYSQATTHYQRALAVFREINNRRGISSIYNNLGVVCRRQGKYGKALEYYQKGLAIQEELRDKKLISYSYNNMGLIYVQQNAYTKALDYYNKSLALKQELNNYKGTAITYNNIALVYQAQADHKQALMYFRKAQKIYETNQLKISPYYSSMGETFIGLNQLDSALVYHTRGLVVSQKTKSKRNQALALVGITQVYFRQHKYAQAVETGKQALELSQKIKELEYIRDAGQELYKSYRKLKNYEMALKYQTLYLQAKDSLFNDSKTRELTRLELSYTFDKKQAIQKAKEKQLKIENEKKLAQERLYLFSVLGILFTVLVVAGLALRSRQVQKRLNTQLTSQKNELQQSQDEIIAQRDYIEKQNNDLSEQKERIESSIKAARTIQQATLPYEEDMREMFRNYFIIYRPKDVVSGDFYWAKQVQNQQIIVIADCTGHGVPGAFMSLIGINLLDKIIFQEGITSPEEVLTRLHTLMNIALRQQNSQKRSGGMDVVVLGLTKQDDGTTKVKFSGAKNGLYYWVPDSDHVEIIKGDRRSIGGVEYGKEPFAKREMTLPKDSVIYAGSDGFQDQNDVKRKKIGSISLIKMLGEITSLPLSKQKHIMEAKLRKHMEGTTQRDDILWVGIKV